MSLSVTRNSRPISGQQVNAQKDELDPFPGFSLNWDNNEWRLILAKNLKNAKDFSTRYNVPINDVKKVTNVFPAFVNSYYLNLIKNKDDPIYLQAIPKSEEIDMKAGLSDPLCEETNKDLPAVITHRYPDRALFRVSNSCAMYCRFCTRKRRVGHIEKGIPDTFLEEGFSYIEKTHAIRDVIISGGDPLMLSDEKLKKILERLYSTIVEKRGGILRIGTRMPVVLPQRITPALVKMLSKYSPNLYVNTHFNHPDEITPYSKKACAMLVRGGIILGNQSVLLKGVNDNPIVMRELMNKLVHIGVRPYYIYQADLVLGTEHFRTSVKEGIKIIYDGLRGHTSGLCVPHFVIDAPGGGGKIPILPEYAKFNIDGSVSLRNYEGKSFFYP